MRGYWDFSVHILTPRVCKFINRPQEKTALEIGYGGGRLLNAACGYFKHAIGVDIHDENEFVEEFLRGLGRSNFQLLKSEGCNINLADGSVDFVYSFIVLQHLPDLGSLLGYLHESYRALKPDGVAQLYFGKFGKLPLKQRILRFLAGYEEISDVEVNHTSLVVRIAKMRRFCRLAGFRILEAGTSYKSVPDGFSSSGGGQNYVTLLKR
jgi:SAM-dependent methyltransferase